MIRIGSIIYCQRYNAIGKIIEINGEEVVCNYTDTEERDLFYCNINEIELLSH